MVFIGIFDGGGEAGVSFGHRMAGFVRQKSGFLLFGKSVIFGREFSLWSSGNCTKIRAIDVAG
jgi:hypothetical protein